MFGRGSPEGTRVCGITHCIASGVFLLSCDDSAGALGLVQGSFATNNSFSLRGPSAGPAADFRDGIPVVRHGRFVG